MVCDECEKVYIAFSFGELVIFHSVSWGRIRESHGRLNW